MTNPDRACPHENFEADVDVNRITTEDGGQVIRYSADIRASCADCHETFRWTGLQAGLSPARPTCSVDETTLRAPLRPASADPDFGITLPGFAIGYRAPDTGHPLAELATAAAIACEATHSDRGVSVTVHDDETVTAQPDPDVPYGQIHIHRE